MAKKRKAKAKSRRKRKAEPVFHYTPPPPRTFTEAEMADALKREAARAVERDRVKGFVTGVRTLPPPVPGQATTIVVGRDTALALVAALERAGY